MNDPFLDPTLTSTLPQPVINFHENHDMIIGGVLLKAQKGFKLNPMIQNTTINSADKSITFDRFSFLIVTAVAV